MYLGYFPFPNHLTVLHSAPGPILLLLKGFFSTLLLQNQTHTRGSAFTNTLKQLSFTLLTADSSAPSTPSHSTGATSLNESIRNAVTEGKSLFQLRPTGAGGEARASPERTQRALFPELNSESGTGVDDTVTRDHAMPAPQSTPS